mmetsp:Transcript_40046/g.100213  ORF Transcript_40046/g.100213 Transcript_40046/m.100213 type:complete len:383 (+) Transcript_40046:1969-3117(+)
MGVAVGHQRAGDPDAPRRHSPRRAAPLLQPHKVLLALVRRHGQLQAKHPQECRRGAVPPHQAGEDPGAPSAGGVLQDAPAREEEARRGGVALDDGGVVAGAAHHHQQLCLFPSPLRYGGWHLPLRPPKVLHDGQLPLGRRARHAAGHQALRGDAPRARGLLHHCADARRLLCRGREAPRERRDVPQDALAAGRHPQLLVCHAHAHRRPARLDGQAPARAVGQGREGLLAAQRGEGVPGGGDGDVPGPVRRGRGGLRHCQQRQGPPRGGEAALGAGAGAGQDPLCRRAGAHRPPVPRPGRLRGGRGLPDAGPQGLRDLRARQPPERWRHHAGPRRAPLPEEDLRQGRGHGAPHRHGPAPVLRLEPPPVRLRAGDARQHPRGHR